MKTLILFLLFAFSLPANAQFLSSNSNSLPSSMMESISDFVSIENLPNTYVGTSEEVEELPFDVKAYLPVNFDPYKGMILDESYALITEEIPFDFNVEEFLPEGFDPYEGMIFEAEVTPEEIDFDFDIEEYLPVGFNPNYKVTKSSM
ncbi:hypothetical protein MWU59_11950 [Flavobacteriaceae bacterium F08102]|nr:hypothetical protein [Flavobacteriaceae bacterium F08102]